MTCFVKLLLILWMNCFTQCFAEGESGVLQLSANNFDKVINAFDVVFVMFSGDHDHNLDDVSNVLTGNIKAIVAHVKLEERDVGGTEYDEYDEYGAAGGEPVPINTELAEKFKISKESWPQFRLFRKGHSEPIKFEPSEDLVESAILFLEKNDVYMGRKGCLKEMDEMAKQFIGGRSDDTARKTLFEKSRGLVEKYVEAEEKSSAKVYVTYMEKATEKGLNFFNQESSRLERLLSGEMSAAKREELQKRYNILKSFTPRPPQKLDNGITEKNEQEDKAEL